MITFKQQTAPFEYKCAEYSLQVAQCSAPRPHKVYNPSRLCFYMYVWVPKKKKSFQAVCHVPSSPLALRYAGLSTQMSQRVSVHLYLNMQGLHRSAAVTHTHTHTVSWCPEVLQVLSTAPTSSAKTTFFCLKATLETGHSSITITLIKRETKAQHSREQQTTPETVNRGLNQNFSYVLKLAARDTISKNKLVERASMWVLHPLTKL